MTISEIPQDLNKKYKERIKELDCLYNFSKLIEKPTKKLDELFLKIVELIQKTMEFPSLTCVKLEFNEKEYKTQNFKKTNNKLSIKVSECELDFHLDVYNLTDITFRQEKVNLVEDIGFRLQSFLKQMIYEEQIELIKLNQEELKKSEKKYKFLYENAPLAYQSLDNNGNILDVNNAWLDLLGYKREEVIDRWIGNFIDPEYIKKFQVNFPRFKEKGKIIGIEYRMIKKNGTKVLFSINGKIGYDENMNFERTHCILQDITERKVIEEKMKEKNKFLINILESITHPFYVIDVSDFSIKLANSAAWADSLPKHIKCHELAHKRQYPCKDEHPCPIEIVKHIKKPITLEHIHYDKGGNKRNVEVHGYPVIDEGGNVSQLIEYNLDITERKKTQEKLKESEEMFRNITEQSLMGIAIIQNGLIKYTSKRFANIYGYSVEEMLNFEPNGFLKLIDTKYYDLVREQAIKKQLGHEDVINQYEVKIITKTGEKRWVENYSSTINYKGKPAILVNNIDITERKKAKNEKNKSEIMFRTIFEAIPDIFFLLNEDSMVLDYKTKKTDDFFLPQEKLLGTRLIDRLPNELRQLTLHKIRATFELRKQQILEFNLSIKDGLHFYEARFLYLSKNQIASIIRDITERKKAEEDLLVKNYALYSSINAIAIANLEGNITYINPSFLKMWGYSDEKEVMGMKNTSFWANEEKANKIISNLRYKQSWTGELIGKKKDGTLFDVLLAASLVRDEINNPICMMATLIDITERKRAEQLIIEENRKLRELSRMKRDLITRVSHELKTPLTSINGASYYIMKYHKDNVNNEILEYLEIIYHGGLRLKELIDDLIDTAGLEGGKITLNKTEANIEEIILNCIDQLKYFSVYRNVALNKDVPEKILIEIDKTRIEQVILNLLSNAIKNTPPYGKVSIILEESKDNIYIHIKDTGVGITKEEKSLLFRKFGKIERYGKGMDIDTEGSGLGLFISKEIVNLHNGDIFFESDGRDKGTTFTVVLPKTLK